MEKNPIFFIYLKYLTCIASQHLKLFTGWQEILLLILKTSSIKGWRMKL